jgi:hypothetical protein
MRVHSFLTAVALTTFVGAQIVGLSPALAWGAYSPVAPAYVPPLPPQLEPWQQVKQVPIFGGEETVGQAPQSTAAPQTAQVPGDDSSNGSSTFVAPGVERNSSGQIERSP